MVKYFEPVIHETSDSIFEAIIREFNVPVTPDFLRAKVNERFDDHFPCLDSYLGQKMNFNKLVEYMTHDLAGSLRKKTSAGLGFKHDRKEIARNHVDAVRSVYELTVFDFAIYWKMFLKDELREIIKATRSIVVGQLHLWIIYMAYLGGLYEWFTDFKPDWSAYGMTDRVIEWTEKLSSWNKLRTILERDIRQQDSNMQPGFHMEMEAFLKRMSPVKHWGAIEWIWAQSFFEKKIVDARGHILCFSKGEGSGFPGTITNNTMHTLYMQTTHTIVVEILNDHYRRTHLPQFVKYKLEDSEKDYLIQGDDTIAITDYPDELDKIVEIFGHKVTKAEGPFWNHVTFLSMKFANRSGLVCPYYCNLDKMYASLRVTTGGDEEYFQKLCSFHRMLIFAPRGSTEYEWRIKIQAHIEYMLQSGLVPTCIAASYKSPFIIKRDRMPYG